MFYLVNCILSHATVKCDTSLSGFRYLLCLYCDCRLDMNASKELCSFFTVVHGETFIFYLVNCILCPVTIKCDTSLSGNYFLMCLYCDCLFDINLS